MNNSVSTMSGKIKIKIVLLGNQSVGKTCIIEKYVKDRFDETANPTVGIDFLVKNVTHQAKNYRLQLWDTAGQQRFRSLIPNYLKDAKCALIVIDVTNRASLNSAESWLKLYNDNKTVEGFTFLIGNKIDLEYREVEQAEAKKKAQELGLPYFEVSAKTGQNLQTLFNKLIQVTENKSVVNFELNKKQDQVIKEEDNLKQEDTEIKEGKTKRSESKPTPGEKGKEEVMKDTDTAPKANIVLKNEPVEKKTEKKKTGCC